MFGFLTQQARYHPDPLLTPKTASGWLRQLPTLDVIGRQQHVMRAFDGMRQARKAADLNRVAAVEFLDSALGADRRQLIKQYVENVDTSARLAERLWQALQEMCQGFIFAYQSSLEQALAQGDNPRWKPVTPRLFSRLIHYYGTDAKLRVFRFERWIPAKWMEMHKLYMRATELGVERVPVALGNVGTNTTHWTIEQEYVFVLLIHQLHPGNLSPPELDWATAQLRAWSRKMQLDAVPRSPEGFFVDVAGKSGLVRRTPPPHRATVTAGPTQPTFRYGRATDVPVFGHWKWTARTGIGVERAGRWLLRNRLSGGPAGTVVDFGAATGRPVAGGGTGAARGSVGMVRGTTFRRRATTARRAAVETRIFVG